MSATKLYGKDIKEFLDFDIDELLSQLTEDEIAKLGEELIDPDVSRPPCKQGSLDLQGKGVFLRILGNNGNMKKLWLYMENWFIWLLLVGLSYKLITTYKVSKPAVPFSVKYNFLWEFLTHFQ